MDLAAAEILSIGAEGELCGLVAVGVPANLPKGSRKDFGPQYLAAAQDGIPALVNDWSREATYVPPMLVRELGLGATLAIPLVGIEACWVLALHARATGAFRPDHVRLARVLSHLLGPQIVTGTQSHVRTAIESVTATLSDWIGDSETTADAGLPASTVWEALHNDRVLLFSQPILDLRTGRVVQEELLLRLRDVGGNLLLPAAFLPGAERDGLVTELDRWVLERACCLASAGRRVQMNVSARTMNALDFVDAAEEAIARHHAPAHNITFEITETALIADMAKARWFASRLTQLGCAFALDDFGTGFAPLTYLKRLPIAYLKVDVEFVRDILSDERSQALAQVIVHIAGTLGLRTIAEGVEDELTLRYLRRIGVDYAQGHFIGFPAEVSDQWPLAVDRRARAG